MGRMKRVTLAWVLTLAMVLSGIGVYHSEKTAKADGTTYDLSVKSGFSATSATIAKNPYGTDYIADVEFDIPSQASSKSMINSNGITSMEVSLTVNSFTAGTGTPSVMLYAQPGSDGDYKWNQSDGVDLVTGQTLNLKFSFSDMNWNGGSTVGHLAIRFANCADGSTVSYTINSAKLVASGSGSSGGSTGGGTPATGEELEGVSAKVNALTVSTDWSEYNLTVTNNTFSAVSNFIIEIPASGSVSNFQSWNLTGRYSDGYILIRFTQTVAANSTYTCTSNEKFGFGGGASLGTPQVKEDDGSYTSSSEVKYALTGETKDVAVEDTPFGKHGKLSLKEVDGYSAPIIVDESGEPFQLRGASTHGMHWNEMTPYVNKGAFQSLRDEWGVNMVRLVSYVTQGGYTQGSQELLDSTIQKGVEAATELGMYVIIDWHIHAESPITTQSQAETFFRKYATMYKDYDNVIFEICNEPTGIQWYNGSGSDLYSYCKDIAGIIQNECENDALIVCGTNTWSQDVDDVAQKPLKDDGFKNILYTFHFYSGSHYDDKMNKVRMATSAGTPIFVTEFGICDASGNGGYDTANADAWIELLDSYNISYACWSLCNKNESASYLLPSCLKTEGGWLESDLSTTGIWLVNTYRAHQDKEENTNTSKDPDATDTPGETDAPGGSTTSPSPTGSGNSGQGEAGTATQTPGGAETDPHKTAAPGDNGTTTQPPGNNGTTTQPPAGTDPNVTNPPGNGGTPTPTPTGVDPNATNAPGNGNNNQPGAGSTGGSSSDSTTVSSGQDGSVATAANAKVTLKKKSLKVKKGKKVRIVIKKKMAGDKVKLYKIVGKKGIVKVSKKGVVKGVKKGKTTVKVVMKSGAFAKCKIKVTK